MHWLARCNLTWESKKKDPHQQEAVRWLQHRVEGFRALHLRPKSWSKIMEHVDFDHTAPSDATADSE